MNTTSQLLLEVNNDLSIPLNFKIALWEFHNEVKLAYTDSIKDNHSKRTLLEFTNLDYAQTKAAFERLPTLDVNKLHVITQVVNPETAGAQVPQGLLSALNKWLTNALSGWIEKKLPSSKNPAGWVIKLKDYLKGQNPALVPRYEKIVRIGGKVGSLAIVAIMAIGIVSGFPFVGPLVGTVALSMLKLLTDILQGVKVSEAVANAVKRLATGAALGGVIAGVDAAWPSVASWISGNAQALEVPNAPEAPGEFGAVPVPTEPPSTGPDATGAYEEPDATGAYEEPPTGRPTEVTTRRGETLGSIAQKHGVTVADMQAANTGIRNPHEIGSGIKLNIPTQVRPEGTNIWNGFDFNRWGRPPGR
jgi:hypothetical protein